MKHVEIEIGASAYTRRAGHSLPPEFTFVADVYNSISGPWGISSDGRCKHRHVVISVPDWIVPSAKWGDWPLSVDGVSTKDGDDNLAFVVCNKQAREEVAYWGQCDQYALIDRAIASGLTLVYPTAEGKKARMPVEIVRVID